MKFKHLFVILALFIGLIAIPTATAHADSEDPDAVLPHRISKSQLAKILKDYEDVWSKVTYYKTTRPVSITVKFSDRNDTKTIHKAVVKIPKNTIVSGTKSVLEISKTKTRSIFQFGFDTLSYALMKPVLTNEMALSRQWTAVYAKKMASINKYFVKVNRPAYMPAYSTRPFYKYPGDNVKFSPWNASTDRVKITPDGYVEFTKINPNQDTYRSFNLVPDASAKIHKAHVKGNTRYLYYSHHVKGVGDRQVAKSGPTKYRLAIKNLHRPFTMFDGDQGSFLMSQYQVGRTLYYTRSGGFSA